jgi:hypothetical protein
VRVECAMCHSAKPFPLKQHENRTFCTSLPPVYTGGRGHNYCTSVTSNQPRETDKLVSWNVVGHDPK